jgi:hypothetical protein
MMFDMTKSYLEVTYRQGKAFAAYVYLPRAPGDAVVRTERRGSMLIDLAADGRALGIELTAPADVRLTEINALLASLHQPALAANDLIPLVAT